MTGMWFCLLGAGICFGMFFGFGPTPDNQGTAICGAICLFFAYICYDQRLREG